MSKHTPGPWTVSYQTPFLVVDSAHVVIASASGVSSGGASDVSGFEQAKANARLIAAAPELLAALKRAASWIKSEAEGNDEMPLVFVVAEAAIAKAEGK